MTDAVEKSPEDIVREFVSMYIARRPRTISLKLDWNEKRSYVSLKGEGLNETSEYSESISFSAFARGVLQAYRDAYGELDIAPVSLREDVYRNDNVSLDLYPTGGAGVFDIFVDYKNLHLHKQTNALNI